MTVSNLIMRVNRLLLLGLCIGVSSMWAGSIRSDAHGAIASLDFAGVYYQTRAALERKDPYDPQVVLRGVLADGQRFPKVTMGPGEDSVPERGIILCDYPPTALLVTAPFAMLRWPVALTVWLCLMGGLLVLAAFLVWEISDETAWLAGCMACFMLANCMLLFWLGNPAGIVVPPCVIAAWCFLKDRFALAGVVVLALALATKPQVAGFVWLYFLLAGGAGRKRALQTLVLLGLLGVCAAIWIAPASPRWLQEEHGNTAIYTAHGGLSDPGPASATGRTFSPVISLQNSISIFDDDPGVYDPVTYLVIGSLILAWLVTVLRKCASREASLLALAAVSILTMLPVYHRMHDAKLLLLTIPGCASLWARGGARRWAALGLTSAAIFVTSDYPDVVLVLRTGRIPISDATLSGKLMLLALQPAPLVLLAAGCFYLWVYIRYEPSSDGAGEEAVQLMKTAAAGA